ncbi:MAG TPA: MlaA family lipoprotein [Thermomonas sp.]|jgi:phospholipid-binding lipoprotein MlaA|nr:MlaA family lipoprotein [Thermomonas sp.]HRA57312.1 MlaA family lipoprotein [Thermomonas sp.]
MNRLLISATLGILLTTTGCASQAPLAHMPPPAATVVAPPASDAAPAGVAAPAANVATGDAAAAPTAAPADLATAMAEAAPAAANASAARVESSADATSADADADFAAIYGTGAANGAGSSDNLDQLDPWEPMNRRVHAFNTAIDHGIMHPLAVAYTKIIPGPLRKGISNVFDNLAAPLAFGNLLLQGRPRASVETLGRFLVNTVIGIGGIFDPATKALKMHRHSADFGRTLAHWGWHESRYLELPLLGPRTVRDAVGAAGDITMAPLTYVEHDSARLSLEALWLVDTRAGLLPLDELREAAPDEYVLTRDAWLARRRYLVNSDRSQNDEGNESLPAYLLEDEPASSPVPPPESH